MVSNRLILVFLGIIFILIVVFSGNRIAQTFKSGLARIFPRTQIGSGSVTPSPTPRLLGNFTSPTPKNGFTKGEQTTAPPETEQIPSTGPQEITYVLFGGSALVGILTRYLTRKKS